MIGIFGGSFNPIHSAHLSLGRALLQKGVVSELWYMVSPQNPLKRQADLLPEELRFELVCLALQDDPHLVASDFEFSLPRPSYTVHTMQALRHAYPEQRFALVIGQDNYACLSRWYRPDDILAHHPLIVFPRQGQQASSLALSSAPSDGEIIFTDTPLLPISSTAIRQRMALPHYNGQDLPPRVWARLSQYLQTQVQ